MAHNWCKKFCYNFSPSQGRKLAIGWMLFLWAWCSVWGQDTPITQETYTIHESIPPQDKSPTKRGGHGPLAGGSVKTSANPHPLPQVHLQQSRHKRHGSEPVKETQKAQPQKAAHAKKNAPGNKALPQGAVSPQVTQGLPYHGGKSHITERKIAQPARSSLDSNAQRQKTKSIHTSQSVHKPLWEMASIKVARVHLRSGPGKKHPVLWTLTLPKNLRRWPVVVVRKKGAWRWIVDGDMRGPRVSGWVMSTFLSKDAYVSIAQDMTPLYSGPHTKASLIAYAQRGALARYMESCDAWVRVTFPHGMKGWVQASNAWPFSVKDKEALFM